MNYIGSAQLNWLFVAQGVSIAPLLIQLPAWITLLWASAITWRWQVQRGVWAYPHMVIKLVLGFVCLIGIYASFGSIGGVRPLVGFLVCAFALKLIELRQRKDMLIILFIGFIAVSAQFLFAQHMGAACFALLACAILLSAWQACLTTRKKPLRKQLQGGFWLLAQSLPFMALTFVVMPRLGPLWAVPLPARSPTTGFSDQLTLGGLGQLAQSGSTAFRAQFDGMSPPLQQLYWRGLVLEDFDGSVWRTGTFVELPAGESAAPGRTYDFEVVLEPHGEPWLFSVGLPKDARSRDLALERVGGQLLRATRPVDAKLAYSVVAVLPEAPWPEVLSPRRLELLTALPGGANPALRRWGTQWQGREAADLVAAAHERFAADFTYTLAPPAFGAQPLDNFFFDAKRGYCEHYAAALAFAARAAGHPARLVVGYQGGQYHAGSNYWQVRQLDAHAWVEIYVAGQGWWQVDPTAAVAPERVESGAHDALGDSDQALLQPSWQRLAGVGALLQAMDAASYRWNRWVLNYDSSDQMGLLRRLFGSANPWLVGAGFVLILLAMAAVVFVWPYLRRRSVGQSGAQKLLQPTLRRLSRHGLRRRPQESLQAFLHRAATAYGPHRAKLLALAEAYDAVVYSGRGQSMQQLQARAREVAQLPRPPRRRFSPGADDSGPVPTRT